MPIDALFRAIAARKTVVGEILRAAFGPAEDSPVATRPLDTAAMFDAVFQ
jgi:hypothetical protein